MKIAVGWVIAAAAVLVLLSACGGDGGEGTPTPDRRTPTPAPESAGVPQVACNPLLTLDDYDEALRQGIGDDSRSFSQAGVFGVSEVCRTTRKEYEGFFVQIQPGEPGDFEPGAEPISVGVFGQPVTGVGDEARWFEVEDSATGLDVGVISVRQVTPLGVLHFRIYLGRPDLDRAAQLEIAKTLALAALPRFPGVEVEPELVTFEPEPFDRSGVSYDDNLLVKEEAGEWTRGEGLVATLRVFAGEIFPFQVLRHPELIDYSGTGVVELAREYLETGPEAEARTEIARLLALLVPSIERLGQEGAIASSEPDAPIQYVSLGGVLQRQDPEEDDWCNQVYSIDSPCVLEVDLPLLDATWPAKYRLVRPVSEVAGGWTQQHVDWVREAMFDSAKVFEPLGKMPKVVVHLTPYVNTVELVSSGKCLITLGPNLIGRDDGEFKQLLALALADCLVVETFSKSHWWRIGLGVYLSGLPRSTSVVYADVNWEHVFSKPLAFEELSTTLMDRKYSNWVLFEYMDPLVDGEEGIFELAGDLPTSIGPFFHDFERNLTDAQIEDIGPGLVPYEPIAWTLQISGPTALPLAPQPFGVVRMHATVDSGKIACLSTFEIGNVESSWKGGAPGGPGGGWTGDLPTELRGESVFLVTTADPGALLDIEVTKVIDDDKDCEEEEGDEEPLPTPTPCPFGCPPPAPSNYYWPLRVGDFLE